MKKVYKGVIGEIGQRNGGHPLEGFCQAKKILRNKKSGIRQNVVKHAVLRRQLDKIKIDKLCIVDILVDK